MTTVVVDEINERKKRTLLFLDYKKVNQMKRKKEENMT
jgi:hypothetical protein